MNARLAAGDRCPFLDQSKCRMHTAARGMEPLTIDRTHILVLNYNGRGLLAECLPSIVLGRRSITRSLSRHRGRQRFHRRFRRAGRKSIGPTVGYVREANHGLASFNRVLERLDEPVVLLAEQRRQARPRMRSGRCSRSLRP